MAIPKSDPETVRERINRGLVVQHADGVDADLLDYLAHTSSADPFTVGAAGDGDGAGDDGGDAGVNP